MAKSNIDYLNVDDWDNLRYTINKYFAHWPEYIFRGQSQSDWLLESTLSRSLKKIKKTNKESLAEQHFKRFKLEIRGRRGQNPKLLDENEIWTLGQHYGLHTPLLDWTESPWVAIFFAITGLEKSSTGKRTLWALHINDVDEINKYYKQKRTVASKKKIVELIEPNIDENNRLVNQRGLFTKIHVENDIENWIIEAESVGDWVSLYKIDFPDSICEKILLYLNLMNINHSSLFPDLYGSSKYSNLRLMQTDYLDELKQKDFDDETDDEE